MKIRFAQLYAAYAAFNRYAAIIVAKTRVQSGGGSLPCQGTAIIFKETFAPKINGNSENLEIRSPRTQTQRDSTRSDYFKEINFAVEHQNKYCPEFVEYVFSAWARQLPVDTLSMAKTSVDENQI